MDLMTMIQAVPGVGPVLPYVLMVFGICAVAAAQLPPPNAAGSPYALLYNLINLLGHNYNQARNAVTVVGPVPPQAAAQPPTKVTTSVPPTAVVALLAALSLPFGLLACTGAGSSPAADVAALEAGLTAAEALATAYVQLPICTGTNRPLCSDTGIVAQIKTADAQAYGLVKAAETAAGEPSALAAAQAAVTALSDLVNTLPKQGS